MEEVYFLQDLVKRAKEDDRFIPRWGKNVRLSNYSKFETKPPDITIMIKYVCRHVNYHSSMIYCGLVGVFVLDRQQPLYSVNNPLIQVGSMLLRHVLYHHMKLAEVYSPIAELHQESELDSVDIVVPYIPEAEAMVAMMNKKLSVYLSNYLVDAGMGKVFVKALIQGEIFRPYTMLLVLLHGTAARKRLPHQRMLNDTSSKCSKTRHGIKMNTVLT